MKNYRKSCSNLDPTQSYVPPPSVETRPVYEVLSSKRFRNTEQCNRTQHKNSQTLVKTMKRKGQQNIECFFQKDPENRRASGRATVAVLKGRWPVSLQSMGMANVSSDAMPSICIKNCYKQRERKTVDSFK
ncbi:hypothetical protein LSAT2_013652 [Lamellibrachia satsuma]|nr:hypothetical protein LSAT2_013652 [Lamellibrachia satsuma]